jgi:hypothetical protein
MANGTLITAVTGIVVAGVLGPSITAWAYRRADRQRFERDQMANRRADLRALLDEGAQLLGLGGTNLRLAHEAVSAGGEEPQDVREWASNVHLFGQRLRLRLEAGDLVLEKFEIVRTALVSVSKSYGSDAAYSAALTTFEQPRAAFLDAARDALEAPFEDAS